MNISIMITEISNGRRSRNNTASGMKIEVEVTKVTVGKDGKTYVTVIHKNASNYPTLIWKD